MTTTILETLSDNKEYMINNLDRFIEFIHLMSQLGYSWFRGQSVTAWISNPDLQELKYIHQSIIIIMKLS